MKKTIVTLSYGEEKLTALKLYLAEKGMNFDDEMKKAIDALYSKNVPLSVKDYFEKKAKAIKQEKKQEAKANEQHRGSSAV